MAILWNGIWHYKKIKDSQSLDQIINRDKIKVREIESYGFTPYIIRDMGRYNIDKVNMEWDIFSKWIESIK